MERKEVLAKVIKRIKSFGLKCYFPVKSSPLFAYVFVTDGLNVCYIEIDELTYWLRLSTIHKPCYRSGTGFFAGLYNPENFTKEDILKGFRKYPKPFRRRKIEPVKYANFEEFRAYEKKFNMNLKEV